ncbi:ComEA family DNA-binding protein [Streptomyces sp. NBC_00690]
MDLRSRSATSGPGRAPASDGRARTGRGAGPTARASRVRPAVGFGTRPGGHGRGPASGGRGSRSGVGRRRLHRASRPSHPGVQVSSHEVARRRAVALFDPPSGSGAGATGAADGPVPLAAAFPSHVRADESQGSAESAQLASVSPSRPPGEVAAGEGSGHGAWRRLALATRERLPLWVQLRCGLEPKTLVALAVVFLVAAVLAAQHFWTGRPETVRAPEVLSEPVAQARTPPPGPAAIPRSTPSTVGRIVVDVAGKVRRPGVLKLPVGSRVADALAAAGGVRAGVDTFGLNRARVLVDGEQVAVGVPAAPVPVPGVDGGAAVAGSGVPGDPRAGGQGGHGAGTARTAGTLSLSTATAEELDTLPGVGPVLVQHIIDYRTQHGGFRSVDQLRDVDGIGDRRFAELKPRVRP